jgi:excinuclease UvrABC nuclease subunit
MSPLAFADLVPSKLPVAGGVYLITARLDGLEEPYYVGRSKNLQRRIYTNHLMGPLANARLKKYLINTGECTDLLTAKQFIVSIR